jgi:hypothetical protein
VIRITTAAREALYALLASGGPGKAVRILIDDYS